MRPIRNLLHAIYGLIDDAFCKICPQPSSSESNISAPGSVADEEVALRDNTKDFFLFEVRLVPRVGDYHDFDCSDLALRLAQLENVNDLVASVKQWVSPLISPT